MSDLLFAEEDDQFLEDENKSDDKTWRVLIVDDEEAIHQVTKLVLMKQEIEGRKLEFFSAFSAKEAKPILEQNDDIALAIVDVVMETDDAGLNLVEWIRRDLKNNVIRLVLRTGQPGKAPEESVIRNFDINDYKDKTELTAHKLITTLYAAIRSYRDIMTIQRSLKAFEHLISTTSSLLKIQDLQAFGSAALNNLLTLMDLDSSALYIVRNQKDFELHEKQLVIACTGKYTCESDCFTKTDISDHVRKQITNVFNSKSPYIDDKCFIGFYETLGHGAESVLYIEFENCHENLQFHLIEMFATNVALILENLSTQQEIERTQKEIMYIVGEAIEARSSETGNHVKRVALMCELLAKKLGKNQPYVHAIKLAAPLHDIGKVAIPDAILHKPGKLEGEEWEIMKSHAKIGGEMLKKSKVGISIMGSRLAYYHHENWDGTGYPDGLTGENIPLEARIMSIVDVLDALGAKRCYKEPWPNDKIKDFIIEQKCKKFDPELVDIAVSSFDEFCKIRDDLPD